MALTRNQVDNAIEFVTTIPELVIHLTRIVSEMKPEGPQETAIRDLLNDWCIAQKAFFLSHLPEDLGL